MISIEKRLGDIAEIMAGVPGFSDKGVFHCTDNSLYDGKHLYTKNKELVKV